MAAVAKILEELDIKSKPTILVFNKQDRFPDSELLNDLCMRYQAVAISALDETTLPPLVEKMEASLKAFHYD